MQYCWVPGARVWRERESFEINSIRRALKSIRPHLKTDQKTVKTSGGRPELSFGTFNKACFQAWLNNTSPYPTAHDHYLNLDVVVMEDAGVSERCRSRMCKHLVLLSLTAVTMLVSVQQVACNTSFAPGMGSLAHNKTLMDELHKKRWIQQLEDFLFLPKKEGGKEEEGKREHGRRSSPAYEKEKIDGGDDSRSAGPNGGSSVTNQLMIPNTNFPGKVNLPYFVFSKSPGKELIRNF